MDTIGGNAIVDVLVFAVFVVARVIAVVAVVVATTTTCTDVYLMCTYVYTCTVCIPYIQMYLS